MMVRLFLFTVGWTQSLVSHKVVTLRLNLRLFAQFCGKSMSIIEIFNEADWVGPILAICKFFGIKLTLIIFCSFFSRSIIFLGLPLLRISSFTHIYNSFICLCHFDLRTAQMLVILDRICSATSRIVLLWMLIALLAIQERHLVVIHGQGHTSVHWDDHGIMNLSRILRHSTTSRIPLVKFTWRQLYIRRVLLVAGANWWLAAASLSVMLGTSARKRRPRPQILVDPLSSRLLLGFSGILSLKSLLPPEFFEFFPELLHPDLEVLTFF